MYSKEVLWSLVVLKYRECAVYILRERIKSKTGEIISSARKRPVIESSCSFLL